MAREFVERRKVDDHRFIVCKQEDNIKEIGNTMIRTEAKIEKLDMRLNGAFEKMAVHVEDSIYWRRFIVGVAVSLVITIIGGIVTAVTISYNLGQYTKQIAVNTCRLNVIEESYRYNGAK
jgi:hypothetical protein